MIGDTIMGRKCCHCRRVIPQDKPTAERVMVFRNGAYRGELCERCSGKVEAAGKMRGKP